MATFPIVGRRFSPGEFADYAAHVPLGDWRPDLVVLHNTAVPTLADRPQGLSEANIQDLRHYYADVQGWSGGPHLFVDGEGVWVFNPLDRRGVHSPSWNARSWGVEMLGDFATEPFDSGNGLKVQRNAMDALAALFRRLGMEAMNATLKLHKEDPRTTHDCPGRNVAKPRVLTAVASRLAPTPSGGIPSKVVVYRKGGGQNPSAILGAALREGTVYADARALSAATGIATGTCGETSVRAFVGEGFGLTWNAASHRVYLVER